MEIGYIESNNKANHGFLLLKEESGIEIESAIEVPVYDLKRITEVVGEKISKEYD